MIICKGKTELQKMREANLIVARVLNHLETLVKAGITTVELAAGLRRDDPQVGSPPRL